MAITPPTGWTCRAPRLPGERRASKASPAYTSSIGYHYDAANRLTEIDDSNAGTITRTYDDRFDEVATETTPQGTVGYTYAANGVRESLTPSGGTAITYAYDAAVLEPVLEDGAIFIDEDLVMARSLPAGITCSGVNSYQ